MQSETLDLIESSEQLQRYRSIFPNLILAYDVCQPKNPPDHGARCELFFIPSVRGIQPLLSRQVDSRAIFAAPEA
ncbi:MAG: hypothetical protein K9N21_03600 [Deltaproteobacteria bacterium]|nr:hypothetical protein [Deltaproteobacteria bacterium]